MDTSILEKLKAETFEYLTHNSNNQIKGFYEFDGYWGNKTDAILKLDNNRKEHLLQLYEYMNSITILDIVEANKINGRSWISKYSKGKGRKSAGEIFARAQSVCNSNTPFIIKNWGILQRVKIHVGAVLNRFNHDEIIEHIDTVANDELNCTNWTDMGSRYSNAIFRLEILKSYLDGTDYQYAIDAKLADVSKLWINNSNINLDDEEINNYNANVIKLDKMIDMVEGNIEFMKFEEKRLTTVRDNLRGEKRDLAFRVNNLSVITILKLKNYIKDN